MQEFDTVFPKNVRDESSSGEFITRIHMEATVTIKIHE